MNPKRIGLGGLRRNKRLVSPGEAIRPRELCQRTNQRKEKHSQTAERADGRIYHREDTCGSCAIEMRRREREHTKYLDLDRRAGGGPAEGLRIAGSAALAREREKRRARAPRRSRYHRIREGRAECGEARPQAEGGRTRGREGGGATWNRVASVNKGCSGGGDE